MDALTYHEVMGVLAEHSFQQEDQRRWLLSTAQVASAKYEEPLKSYDDWLRAAESEMALDEQTVDDLPPERQSWLRAR